MIVWCDAHRGLAEVEPLLVHVEDGDRRPGQLDELDDRQPDRPGPDDQHVVPGLRGAAIDRVAADAQRLHQGELVERELLRRVELAGRDDELRAQPAVGVDAEDLQVLAAVRPAAPAGEALLAVHVRLDRAAVAGPDVPRHRDDDSTPRSGTPRVAESGILPR